MELIERILLAECNRINTDLDAGLSPLGLEVMEDFHSKLNRTHEAIKRMIKDGDYRVVS